MPDPPPTPDAGPSARALWMRFEPVHAVTYFAPDCAAAFTALGLRGFWMGYFAARAAPLGPVGPAPVAAVFFNFHPDRVARALPDAWSIADPVAVLETRRTGAPAALRRIVPAVEEEAPRLNPLVARMVDAADGSGRALFSANQALEMVDDPVEALWQGCTGLREHRGDGHVAALVAAGLDGCESLVLFSASHAGLEALFRSARGWSEAEWHEAEVRLGARGLLDSGRLTQAGMDLRAEIEQVTDELATRPGLVLSAGERWTLAEGLGRLSAGVTDADLIPYPNPIGLPRPD